MLALVYFFRLLLAGVFILAGLTKLRDLARTQADFESLGIPSSIAPALSFRLPFVELIVGGLLLIEPLTDLGAVCALGLLTVFTAVIGANLWRGRRPACACFGSLTRARIGPGTLVRNACLMAVAGALLVPPSAAQSTLTALSPTLAWILAFTFLAGMGLFGAWWVLQLWRQQGRLLLRIEQLEQRSHIAATTEPQPVPLPRPPELVGQPAPALALYDVTGRLINLQSLRGTPTVLLFLDATCKHCRPLLSRLRTWRPSGHVIVVLAGHQPRAIEFAPGIVVVTDDAPNAMQAFGIHSTPAAIAVDADGIVAEPVARGNAAVAQLMDRMTEQSQWPEAQHELAPV